jgi:hypothetical protein
MDKVKGLAKLAHVIFITLTASVVLMVLSSLIALISIGSLHGVLRGGFFVFGMFALGMSGFVGFMMVICMVLGVITMVLSMIWIYHSYIFLSTQREMRFAANPWIPIVLMLIPIVNLASPVFIYLDIRDKLDSVLAEKQLRPLGISRNFIIIFWCVAIIGSFIPYIKAIAWIVMLVGIYSILLNFKDGYQQLESHLGNGGDTPAPAIASDNA